MSKNKKRAKLHIDVETGSFDNLSGKRLLVSYKLGNGPIITQVIDPSFLAKIKTPYK